MKLSLSAFCRALGISRNTAKRRIQDGWDRGQIKDYYKEFKRAGTTHSLTVQQEIAKANLIAIKIEEGTGRRLSDVLQELLAVRKTGEAVRRDLGIDRKTFELIVRYQAPALAEELLKQDSQK